MNNKIVIFQIGSVKDFVNTARKTRDYWAGSFLLSFLNLIAIKTFESKFPHSVIYPYTEEDSLSQIATEYITTNKKISFKGLENIYGNLPNRFTAIVSAEREECEKILEECKNNIESFLKTIKEDCENHIEKILKELSNDNNWKVIWDRQFQDIISIYWSIYDYNTQYSYEKNYTEAELFFAGKKNMRLFTNVEEPGFKCTICGIRQIFIDKDCNSKYNYYNEFWNKLIKHFHSYFKENERLCSVCITRRLFPKVTELNIKFPSTSTIATMPFIFFLKNRCKDLNTDIKEIEDILFNSYWDYEKNNLFKDSDKKLYNLDGDYFILSNYDNDKFWDKSISLKERNKIKEILENIIDLSKEENANPYKYYAVIKFDIDNLGEKIEKCKNKDEHKELSKNIYRFLSETLKKIVSDIKYAKILYAGGDEGIIFVHLDYLFELLTLIRSCFKGNFNDNKEIDEEIRKCNEIFNKDNITISTGVVIAHHQESLKDVLNELENTLKTAKADKYKDKISFTIMKRSGEILRDITFKWLGTKKIITKYLKDLQKMYKENKISKNLVYDLKNLFFLGEKESDEHQIKIVPIKTIKILEYFTSRNIKDKKTEDIKNIINEIDDIKLYTNLLTLASYISDGGGAWD